MKKSRFKNLLLLHIVLFISIISSLSFSETSTLNGATINVGDFVAFGRYENEPIIWQVVSVDPEGNPLLFSSRILTVKAYDASGSQYEEDGFEKYYGSNRWETSTLRKWLNSDDLRVKWTHNAPNAQNVFLGESPYSQEAGFMHKSNFSAYEKSLIKETTYTADQEVTLNDKVFLLSVEEAEAYEICAHCYPVQHLKHQALSKPSDIWTRDRVSDAPYTVNTLKWDGSQSQEVANVSRSGVAPALKLDLDKIESLSMMGNGLSYKPYYFKLEKDNRYLTIFFLSIIGLIGAGLVYKLLRGARLQSAFMLVAILLISLLLTA